MQGGTSRAIPSPRRRAYVAELGTFADLSGSSHSAYQAPHRRFYDESNNPLKKIFSGDDDQELTTHRVNFSTIFEEQR
jgi:hypothetical protein